jgi:hypothetical protein
MHPSSKIFATIQSLWLDDAITNLPAFFSLAENKWERIAVADLEKFYQHICEASPGATAILTSYSVGTKRMLVAHYESSTDTCHRVWTIQDSGKLITVYESPVGRVRKAA